MVNVTEDADHGRTRNEELRLVFVDRSFLLLVLLRLLDRGITAMLDLEKIAVFFRDLLRHGLVDV